VCEVHEVFSRAQDALLEQLAGASLASVVGGSMGGPSGRPDT
jgi:homoserine acetyltransferase